MGIAEALDIYGKALTELATFEGKHKDLLVQLNALQNKVADYKGLVTKIAHDEKQGGENEYFTVTYTPKMTRWYDADKILEMAPYVAQMPGVMQVNRERIAELAKAKAIPDEVALAAYHEEPMTPAVSIKAKVQK